MNKTNRWANGSYWASD